MTIDPDQIRAEIDALLARLPEPGASEGSDDEPRGLGLAELEVGQSKDEDVVSLAVHPFGRSKLTLEDIKQAMDLRPVDALPRLKPMGFGGDSATSLLRGLTGGSRPETAPSLQNIQ